MIAESSSEGRRLCLSRSLRERRSPHLQSLIPSSILHSYRRRPSSSTPLAVGKRIRLLSSFKCLLSAPNRLASNGQRTRTSTISERARAGRATTHDGEGGSEAQNDRHFYRSCLFRYRGSPLLLLPSRSEIVIVIVLELVLGFFLLCRPRARREERARPRDPGDPRPKAEAATHGTILPKAVDKGRRTVSVCSTQRGKARRFAYPVRQPDRRADTQPESKGKGRGRVRFGNEKEWGSDD